ncbi:MAG: hypothetical protein Q9175_005386 [Cornicularia normoerica]
MGLGKTEIVLGFKQKRYKVKVERLRLRLQGQSTLGLYESYLEEVAEKLVGVLRPPKANRRDLKALLKANKPDRGHYHFGQRLAFVMNKASIDNLPKELADSALTLKDFVDDNEDVHQVLRSNKEPQQAKQTRVANSLHKAASKGGKTAVRFTTLFSWQKRTAQESVSWHEIPILTLDEDSPQVLRHTGAKTSAENEVPPPKGSVQIEVTSICKTLAEFQPPVLQLSSETGFFGAWSRLLRGILEGRRQMDPEDRIKLAVNLAASLLQYNLTPWLRRCWTKNAVHFFVQTRTVSGIDVEHPLIIKHFSDQANEILNEIPENDPELALMELGIMLLEIWDMRTFESWLKTAG